MPSLNRSLKSAAVAALALVAVGAVAVSPMGGGIFHAVAATPEKMVLVPAPTVDVPPGDGRMQTVVLAGGCFWGVQGVFQRVKGVRSAVSGYSGGSAATANYELVSSHTTGHAESVQITYDPKQISFGTLLRIYFSVATDPTQLNMQYPDRGPQYRGEIFYTSPDQKRVAQAYIAQLNAAHIYKRPIATRVDPLRGFYKAEGYHQNYLTLHPDQPYIATYDLPKVDALKRLFPAQYRADPVLVGGARS